MNKLLLLGALGPLLFLFCMRFFPNVTIYAFMTADFLTPWSLFDSPMFEKYHQFLISTLDEKEEGKVPELFAHNFTVEEVIRLSKGYTFPVIIRGVLKDSPGVATWTDRKWWVDTYGNEQILCGTFDNVRTSCTVNDFFDELANGKPFYISGASKIFTKNKALVDMIENDKILPIEPGTRMSTQIFMGLPDMGSDIHCAVGVNM
jgi:hypothetical protein